MLYAKIHQWQLWCSVCGSFLKKTYTSCHLSICPISLNLDKWKGCEGWDLWCDGILVTSRHPWSLCVTMCHTYLKDKHEIISKKLFTVGLAVCWSLQSSDRGSRANEGQIYVHHSGDLSCFPYIDWCAAASTLSHNAGLNRSTITSFSLWKLKLCKVFTALTCLLSLTFNTTTAYLLLNAAQIT